MCGRFVSNTPPDELARFLRAQASDPGDALLLGYSVMFAGGRPRSAAFRRQALVVVATKVSVDGLG